MRVCKKCGKKIPNWVKVDNKQRNLCNRKFCLDCSPFGRRNTSKHDPFERAGHEGKKWKEYTEKQKDSVKIANYYRALRLRKELYDKLGGKCKICGYSKCDRALSFHHRNPAEKLFGLALNNLWSRKKEEIEKEAEKCDLLCMNCHAEVEDSISRKNNIVNKVKQKYGTGF